MAAEKTADKPALKPVYLILGDDHPKVERALSRLRERIVEDAGTDLNIDEFDAGRDDAAEVVAAANTMAFLAGVRLVLVHSVDSWRAPQKQVVARYLQAPAPDACLALVGEKLPANDALRRAVAEAGDVLEYRAPRSRELPEWATAQAARLGLRLEPAQARLLVEKVGEDQFILLRELEKLAAYCGDEPVRADDIALLASSSAEARVFDLLDAVAAGQGGQAFAQVEELYMEGESPVGLFYRLLRHFEKLGQTVGMLEEGFSADEIREELGTKSFHARKITGQARNFDSGSMRTALGILAETDGRLKGRGTLPPGLELELCLGRLLALR